MEIEKVQVKKGSTLLFHFPEHLSEKQIESSMNTLKEILPEFKCALISGIPKIHIIEPLENEIQKP